MNDPFIQNITKEVIGRTKNVLFKAIKIHNYLIDNLEYAFDGRGRWYDAVTVLKRGNGSCS